MQRRLGIGGAPLAGLVLAVALAGCDPPTAYDLGKELLPTAGPLCAAALDSGASAGTPAPGAIAGPAVAFVRLDEKFGYGTAWGAFGDRLVPEKHAKAGSADDVRAVVCVQQIFTEVGKYQATDSQTGTVSEMIANRIDFDIRVLRWPGGELLAARSFQGADPPEKVELQPGLSHWSGNLPIVDASNWLDEVLAE